MKLAPHLALIALVTCATACASNTPAWPVITADKSVDGQFPPPSAPADLQWDNLLSGKLTDHWTGMSMPIDSPYIKTTDAGGGNYVLLMDRGPKTGLIRSLKPYENFILEFEWRHLTEAPSAHGGKDPATGKMTSGNSGVIICHSAFPKVDSPYPNEGHEIQVCNLGNGSWYTSHGDTFTLPGSVSEGIPDPRFAVSYACGHRSMPVAFHGSKTGEWNKIRITCVDGVIQHEVNGFLASTLYRASPRKGYMSFESEGGPAEFRNMRIHELESDPDLAAKHVAPLLPEEMTTEYVVERKLTALPTSDFIASVDVKEKMKLSELISGLGLPDTEVSGRVMVSFLKDGANVTQDGKEIFKLPVIAIDGAVPALHLETGKFGHVLIFKPVKK